MDSKVIVKAGKLPGKTVAIFAGVHGNETCGIKAFDKILPSLELKTGKAYFVYANLEAIKQNKRFIEQNLNRCFLKHQPKNIKNSLEGKTARDLMPILNEADALLDVHASNSKDSVPFVICEKHSFDLAKVLQLEIISSGWDEFEPGSTDHYMNLQNKPAVGIECGYLGDTASDERAESAIISFLIKNNLIDGELPYQTKKTFYKIIFLYKNTQGPFRKSMDFADFTKLKERVLVGFDGNKKVFAEKGNVLLFVRDRANLNEECFLIAQEEKPAQ